VRQGRIDLIAAHRGVLAMSLEGVERINAIDPLELFTRWNHQPVEAGETVASVKVAPHVVDREAVLEGARLAGGHTPLLTVRPYAGVAIAAVVAEPLAPEGRDRFEAASRLRAESLDGVFLGVHDLDTGDPTAARNALEELALGRRAGVLLIGGVSAGDPLSPIFSALEALGGVVYRRGVPAHPGSMLWLGRLGDTQLLGLPRCGAFGMATAADLLLPRLMTGETFTTESIASLGHGGLLGREMRPRFPAYARELPEPPAS
jgi:molybdopterin biosynthesis enzyme